METLVSPFHSVCIIYLFIILYIATHTITLHLDMTQLDLADSKPSCTRSDLMKYRRLGLTVEEIVEVAMKLSALKTLGINLKIEGSAVLQLLFLRLPNLCW